MAGPEERSLAVDGTTLRLCLQRKAVKHVNARLRGDTLWVSAPLRLSGPALEPMMVELARRLLRRVQARRADQTGRLLVRAQRIAARFPEPPRVTGIHFAGAQASRWGSYAPRTGIVRLNPDLAAMPTWVLEAVIAHELAHAVHLDHSDAFWTLLRQVCPNTDRARGFLEGVGWHRSAFPKESPVTDGREGRTTAPRRVLPAAPPLGPETHGGNNQQAGTRGRR